MTDKPSTAPNGRKFKGALAQPIELPQVPLAFYMPPESETGKMFVAEAQTFWKDRDELLAREYGRKLKLLAEAYGLVGDLKNIAAWQLVLKMAIDFVPGFKTTDEKAKSGRPKSPFGDEFHLSVAQFLKRAGLAKTDAEAARIIAESEIEVETEGRRQSSVRAPRPTKREIGQRARTVANSISAARKPAKVE